MALTWRKDSAGNRVSSNIIGNRQFILKIYKDNRYDCHTSKAGSEAGIPALIFKGESASIQEAMKEAEKNYIKYNHLEEKTPVCKQPEILIQNWMVHIIYDLKDTIKFTTNGADVKKNSKVYKEPFRLGPLPCTIKVKAFNKDKEDSEQVTLELK